MARSSSTRPTWARLHCWRIAAKARAGAALVRKKIGMRYVMSVVPLDPSPVRGTHGRLPESAADTPVLLCSDAALPFWDGAPESVPAARVRDLVLQAARVTGAAVGP